MNDEHDDTGSWARAIAATAQGLRYPPTPHLASAVGARLHARRRSGRARWAWAAVVAVCVLIASLAVPEVRAAVARILRIGAVQIIRETPPPAIEPTPITSVFDLPGETTLEAVEAQAPFAIALPSHPPGIGAPDRVYWQGGDTPQVTLAWFDPALPGRLWFSLMLMETRSAAFKYYPWEEQVVTVRGQPAVWLSGVHMLYIGTPAVGEQPVPVRRLVEQNVLIWERAGVTYRLESALQLEEALSIAESVGS